MEEVDDSKVRVDLEEVTYPGDRKVMEDKLKITTVAPGDGKTYPKEGDIVTIHYIGKFKDTDL